MTGLQPGAVIGDQRYVTVRALSRTQDADVWIAQDNVRDELVTLVVVPMSSPTALAVVDAASRSAGVDNPRLVRVLDVGREYDYGYFAEESLDGATTLTELAGGIGMAAEEVRRLTGETALALDAASRRGLHHLGLTPDNVLRMPDGSVKVTGLATQAALAGQDHVAGKRALRRDAKGLVSLAYAGLTGRWPLGGEVGLPPAPRVVGGVPRPSEIAVGIPADLDTIIALTLNQNLGPVSPGDFAAQIAPWSRMSLPGADSLSIPGEVDRDDSLEIPVLASATPFSASAPDSPATDHQHRAGMPETTVIPQAAGAAAGTAAAVPEIDAGSAPDADLRSARATSAESDLASESDLARASDLEGASGESSESIHPSQAETTEVPVKTAPRIRWLSRTKSADEGTSEVGGGADGTAAAAGGTAVAAGMTAHPAAVDGAAAHTPGAGPTDTDTGTGASGSTHSTPETASDWQTAEHGDPGIDRAAESTATERPGVVPAAATTESGAAETAAETPGAVDADSANSGATSSATSSAGAIGSSATGPAGGESGAAAALAGAGAAMSAALDKAGAAGRRLVGKVRGNLDSVGDRARTATTRAEGAVTEHRELKAAIRRVEANSEVSIDQAPQQADLEPPVPLLPPEAGAAPTRAQSRFVLASFAAAVALAGIVAGAIAFRPPKSDLEAILGPDTVRPSSATSTPSSATSTATSTPGGDEAVVIVGATGYDPEGDGTENNDLGARVFDEDPNTAWQSEGYQGPKFGGLKSGVGLVVDLGQDVTPSSVTLTLPNPSSVDLYLGTEPDRAGANRIGTVNQQHGVVTVPVTDGATGRYVIVWFTDAPLVSDGRYRAMLSEISVNG